MPKWPILGWDILVSFKTNQYSLMFSSSQWVHDPGEAGGGLDFCPSSKTKQVKDKRAEGRGKEVDKMMGHDV